MLSCPFSQYVFDDNLPFCTHIHNSLGLCTADAQLYNRLFFKFKIVYRSEFRIYLALRSIRQDVEGTGIALLSQLSQQLRQIILGLHGVHLCQLFHQRGGVILQCLLRIGFIQRGGNLVFLTTYDFFQCLIGYDFLLIIRTDRDSPIFGWNGIIGNPCTQHILVEVIAHIRAEIHHTAKV